MRTINFFHGGVGYSGETWRTQALGGTQSAVVQLAEALAKRGHRVTVFNGVMEPKQEYGVSWQPLSNAFSNRDRDIGIAVASPKSLGEFRYEVPIFWLHNPSKSWRQIKNGNIWPLMRSRPAFVLLGSYHKKHVPSWLPSSSRHIIHHGLAPYCFRTSPAHDVPKPRLMFTSQPYRGLEWLLALWPKVQAKVPEATFDIFFPKQNSLIARFKNKNLPGVHFHEPTCQQELLHRRLEARVQAVTGHYDETYCLAAAEATAAGLPIVTRGYGALKERVKHGITGFIAPNESDFIDKTIALLTDQNLWHKMHRSCVKEPSLSTWDQRAHEWEALFDKIQR